jgi:2-amino-4-hydroxy-6-hydroxymethyldihydropteridine diphosphokinase
LNEAYVALGANLGDRDASLREALRRMAETPGVAVLRISRVYETDPVGYVDQPVFLNMAAALATRLSPVELLGRLLSIEREMGRVRDIRWGPRTIDLDLLVYQDVVMDTPELTLPHPRMGERAFVLAPLRDVWPPGEAFPWQESWEKLMQQPQGIRLRGNLDDPVGGKE